MHRCFRANGNGHAVEKAGSLQFAESSPSLRGSSLSLSDLTMEAFLLLFLVRSSRWPLETRVSFPRARSHFISSAILLRLFLLSLSLLLSLFASFLRFSVLPRLALSKAIIARGPRFEAGRVKPFRAGDTK